MGSVFDALGYTIGQCTDFVAKTLGWIPGNLGNANQWLTRAAAQGYATSRRPVIGSVAVWGSNVGGAQGAGHVAVVTGVQASGLPIVQEENWTYGPGRVDTRAVSASSAAGIIGYILPPGTPSSGHSPGAGAPAGAATLTGTAPTPATLTGLDIPNPVSAGADAIGQAVGGAVGQAAAGAFGGVISATAGGVKGFASGTVVPWFTSNLVPIVVGAVVFVIVFGPSGVSGAAKGVTDTVDLVVTGQQRAGRQRAATQQRAAAQQERDARAESRRQAAAGERTQRAEQRQLEAAEREEMRENRRQLKSDTTPRDAGVSISTAERRSLRRQAMLAAAAE